MTDKNIRDLPRTSVVTSSDVIHLNQGGLDRSITTPDFLSEVNGGSPFNVTVIEDPSDSRTLSSSDINAYIYFTFQSTAVVTVPLSLSDNMKIGETITIRNDVLGNVVISGEAGVNISQAASGLVLSEIGQVGQILKVGSNSYHFLTGGTATTELTVEGLSFSTVATLKSAVNASGTTISDWGDFLGQKVSTVVNNTISNQGGKDYIITNVNPGNLSTLIGGIWVGANHDLGGGFYAALVIPAFGLTPEMFGAVADNRIPVPASPIETTASIQSWLDYDLNFKFLPAGNYYCDNLTIPNRTCEYRGYGRLQSQIRCISSPTNTDYFVANESYVNNSTGGGNPIQMSGIRIWNRGHTVDNFVWYGFGSLFEKNYFWGQGAGAALKISGNGISGSTAASTLVENEIKGNYIRGAGGGVGRSLEVSDANAKLTDMIIQSNFIFNSDVFIQTTAGANITDNHLYGMNFADIRGLSIGTVISNNYFEDEVRFNNFIDENVVVGPGNNFNEDAVFQFGGSGRTVSSKSNRFYGNAQAVHDFFGSNKILYSMNDTFETATPYAWTNPSSSGRITVVDSQSFATCDQGQVLQGSKTANTGNIHKKWFNFSAPTTGTWSAGDIVYTHSSSVDVNDMILIAYKCTAAGSPGTWVPMYCSTVSPAT